MDIDSEFLEQIELWYSVWDFFVTLGILENYGVKFGIVERRECCRGYWFSYS